MLFRSKEFIDKCIYDDVYGNDNKIYWRCELPITNEVLGLGPYREDEQLKKMILLF